MPEALLRSKDGQLAPQSARVERRLAGALARQLSLRRAGGLEGCPGPPARLGRLLCAYANRRRRTLEAMSAACPLPARVLDLAAAQRNVTIAIAGLGYDVTWNDLRSDLAEYVRLKTPASLRIEYLAGDIFELGAEQLDAWDAVVAPAVIEHVAHPDEFVRQLAAPLRHGGSLVLTTPNGGCALNKLPRFSERADPSVYKSVQFKPNADGHIFLLYEDEIRRFAARAGLEVTRFDLVNNTLTSGHLETRFLLDVLLDAMVGAGGDDDLDAAPRIARPFVEANPRRSSKAPGGRRRSGRQPVIRAVPP